MQGLSLRLANSNASNITIQTFWYYTNVSLFSLGTYLQQEGLWEVAS